MTYKTKAPKMRNVLLKINRAALKFLGPLPDSELYSTMVKEAMGLVRAEHGSIFLEEGGDLKRVYGSSPLFNAIKIRKGGFVWQTFRSRKPYSIGINQVERIHPTLKAMGIKSILLIPLSYRNKSTGVLTIQSLKDRDFTDKELVILKLFGSMASLAIRKNQLYAETQKALALRDLFISMAVHELRTPVTTITVYLQLLKKRLLKTSDTIVVRWIEDSAKEVSRLSNLINELLAVNRIKAGELRYTWKECKLGSIANRAIGSIQLTYPERKIDFKNLLDGRKDSVIGDNDKLLQVFVNLLENAIKFSPAESEVAFTLGYRKPNFVVEIRDRGRGIPKEDLPRIFEGFYKGGDTQNRGMGIGLFLTKNIIEKHKGQIFVRSQVGKGTTIGVKLPESKI